MIDDPVKHHLKRIQHANSAVHALLYLKFKIFDESETGEMPDWWGESHQEGINDVIICCAETIEASATWLDNNYSPSENDHAGE